MPEDESIPQGYEIIECDGRFVLSVWSFERQCFEEVSAFDSFEAAQAAAPAKPRHLSTSPAPAADMLTWVQ